MNIQYPALSFTSLCQRDRYAMTALLTVLVIAALVVLVTPPPHNRVSPLQAAAPPATAAAKVSLGKLPLYFIEKQGQSDAQVAYYLHGGDTSVYFTADGLTLALQPPAPAADKGAGKPELLHRLARPEPATQEKARERWAVKVQFMGAEPVKPQGRAKTAAVVSYFKGAESDWKAGLPTYNEVVYPGVWPGIDVVYSGDGGRLKTTFHVQPGTDPRRIELAYQGATGVTLTDAGRLAVQTPVGGFEEDRPVVYQEIDGRRVPVEARYTLAQAAEGEWRYGFALDDYDPSRPLIIDPAILVYCGYIGGSGDDSAGGIAVDGWGQAYVTGSTYSTETSFPVRGGPDLTFNGGWDAFVAKLADTNLMLHKGAAPNPVFIGQPLTYTLTVSNNGQIDVPDVVVKDTLPAGVTFSSASSGCSYNGVKTVTCNVGVLTAGASAGPTITVIPTAAGSIQNTAQVTSETVIDDDLANNQATVTTTVQAAADLALTQTDSPDPVIEGQPLTYLLTVTNQGPSTADTVMLTDTLPASVTFVSASAGCSQTAGIVTCNLGNLATGATVQVQIQVTPQSPGTLQNTATVSSATADPNGANNQAQATTTVQAAADLALTKTDTPDPVMVGQPLTYLLTVTNQGPDTADNVVLTDTLPATVNFTSASAGCSYAAGTVTCNLGNLANGATVQAQIQVTPQSAGTLQNTATVSSTTTDPNGANNQAQQTTMVQPLACDIDRDGDVDRNDINAITAARNQHIAPGDPRDYDGDGLITVGDARACVLKCTRPNCAIQ